MSIAPLPRRQVFSVSDLDHHEAQAALHGLGARRDGDVRAPWTLEGAAVSTAAARAADNADDADDGIEFGADEPV